MNDFDPVRWVFTTPWAPLVVALALLVIGVPMARQSKRPRLYVPGVITLAGVILGVWGLPSSTLYLLPVPVATVLLVFGFAEAPKFRQPDLCRAGAVATALALLSVPLLVAFGGSVELSIPSELEGPAVILALIVLALLFFGGLQLMGQADK